MHLARTSLAVLAAGLVWGGILTGCSQRRVYFQPVSHEIGPGVGLTERARYTLAAEGGRSATATLAVQGLLGKPNDKDPRNRYDRLTVSIAVRNGLDHDVVLPLKDFQVVDDDNEKLTAPAVFGKQAQDGALTVPPGERYRATLIFEFPEDHGPGSPSAESCDGGALKRVGSLRLIWSARVADQSEDFETKFLRTAEPEVYYASPYPYDSYGWGSYGYPYGYPYWGYPYGYGWGSFGWGPGYLGGHYGFHVRRHRHHDD